MTTTDYHNMKVKFLEEARKSAQFQHPGIPGVYDTFEENNTAYTVMEYLKGRTLLAVVEERGVLPEREAVGYVVKVGEALEVIHQAGQLHLNIKPDNILLAEDGRVILTGFVSAAIDKAIDELIPDWIRDDLPLRDDPYWALEQYASKARLGPFTDIYALGATLYHLLTGRAPVPAHGRALGLGAELPHVRQLRPEVSEQVATTVMAALAMPVSDRPQTVREFLTRLTGDV